MECWLLWGSKLFKHTGEVSQSATEECPVAPPVNTFRYKKDESNGINYSPSGENLPPTPCLLGPDTVPGEGDIMHDPGPGRVRGAHLGAFTWTRGPHAARKHLTRDVERFVTTPRTAVSLLSANKRFCEGSTESRHGFRPPWGPPWGLRALCECARPEPSITADVARGALRRRPSWAHGPVTRKVSRVFRNNVFTKLVAPKHCFSGGVKAPFRLR